MLWLTSEQVDTIIAHARDVAPHEACGILAGRDNQVNRVIPAPNVADDPHHRFYIDPSALSRALSEINTARLDLIGFYHSHPNGEPIPSTTDINEAHYPDSLQVIIGLKHQTPKIAVWRIERSRVMRVELHIGDFAPTHATSHPALSTAQRNAILLSAIIAVVVMLIVSISLLPPAPPIP